MLRHRATLVLSGWTHLQSLAISGQVSLPHWESAGSALICLSDRPQGAPIEKVTKNRSDSRRLFSSFGSGASFSAHADVGGRERLCDL